MEACVRSAAGRRHAGAFLLSLLRPGDTPIASEGKTMSSSIRTGLLLGAALVPAVLAAACDTVEDVACPLMDCAFEGDEGVRATLVNAVERFKGDAPVTVTLCAASRCAEVELRLAGNSFACISSDVRVDCTLRDDGTIDMGYAVKLPEPKVPVRVTVQNTAGETVFEETQTVTVEETKPSDLDCPQRCRDADVVFSPGPVSQ